MRFGNGRVHKSQQEVIVRSIVPGEPYAVPGSVTSPRQFRVRALRWELENNKLLENKRNASALSGEPSASSGETRFFYMLRQMSLERAD